MTIKFGLRIPCSYRADEIARMAEETEKAGFDIVWHLDSQLLNRDAWITMALSGMRTSRVTIGLNVTNPITRHPTVTASAACTLEELIPGRFILGIGSGDSSVRPMGYKRATVAELRDAIQLIRTLQAGEFVEYNGHRIRIKAAAGERRIPIYQSATGPRMLELAGEMADGVIMLLGVSPECLNWARQHLDVGAARAGRRLDGVEIVCGTFCVPSDTYADAVEQIRPIAATYMIDHKPVLEQAGISVPRHIDMGGLYPDVIHAENWELAMEKTRSWMPFDLAAEFGEKFCLLGTPHQIADKLRRIANGGFTRNFYIRGYSTYRYPTEVAQAFREVIPLLR